MCVRTLPVCLDLCVLICSVSLSCRVCGGLSALDSTVQSSPLNSEGSLWQGEQEASPKSLRFHEDQMYGAEMVLYA